MHGKLFLFSVHFSMVTVKLLWQSGACIIYVSANCAVHRQHLNAWRLGTAVVESNEDNSFLMLTYFCWFHTVTVGLVSVYA